MKSDESIGGFVLEGTNVNQILSFSYKLPIFQSQSEGWKVSITNAASDNVEVSLEEQSLGKEAGGKGVLTGRIRVDPSLCCPGTTNFVNVGATNRSRIVVRWNTNAIVEKALILRMPLK